jgi:cell division topological specificity factor
MKLFDLFKTRGSAPVARERLQVLLAYERNRSSGQPDLVAMLREDIMAVIARHIQIDQDDVRVTMDRGDTVSMLEIDICIPNSAAPVLAEAS